MTRLALLVALVDDQAIAAMLVILGVASTLVGQAMARGRR